MVNALDAIEDDRDAVILALIAIVSDKNPLAYLAPVGEMVEALTLPLRTGRLNVGATTLADCFDSFRSVAQTSRVTRASAMQVLARIGTKATAAVPVLTECLKDEDLRTEARKTLTAIRGGR